MKTQTILLLLLLVPTFALAQGVAPELEDDKWSFAVGAYLFASSIEGVTTIGPKDIETDVSFSELIDSVDGAYSVHFETLSPSRIGIGVDYLYTKIGQDGIETPLQPVIVDNASITNQTVELFGYYHLGDVDAGPGSLDIIGGTRYRSMENNTTLSIFERQLSDNFGASWWDLMAGGRWARKLHPRVVLSARADAGTDAFNFQGGVAFRIARRFVIVAQYKYLNFDHEQETDLADFGYDATEQGVLVGFGFHF
jgi:hypothetical protein